MYNLAIHKQQYVDNGNIFISQSPELNCFNCTYQYQANKVDITEVLNFSQKDKTKDINCGMDELCTHQLVFE